MAAAQLGTVVRHIRTLAASQTSSEKSDGALLRAFLSGNDQSAFEALLLRHGPMVLRVCRRALHDAHDAEDVFQGTFLALAQQAASVRKCASLASWLHGVAYRMATQAKRAAARRHKHESQANARPPRDPALSAAWQELQALLDEEIAALPETLHGPFVICCLENTGCAEAARQLGLQESTVRMRLSRARKILRERLARRGVSLTAVLAVVALDRRGVSAALSRSLVASTAQAASQIIAGQALPCGLISTRTVTLLQGATRAMFLNKCKTAMLLLLWAALAGAGLGLVALCRARAEQPTSSPPTAPGAASKEAGGDAKEVVKVRGRVLDPEGKPLAGAKLYLGHHGPKDEVAVTERARSDAAGRFEFRFLRSQLRKAHPDRPIGASPGAPSLGLYESRPRGEGDPFSTLVGQVVAVAKGHGCDWARVDAAAGSTELTLRLVKDVPISGRILNEEGKPVAGARVRLGSVQAYPGKKFDAALAAFRKSNYFPGGAKRWGGPLPGQARAVTTGRDGRFRMAGLGGERHVSLHIEGTGIASTVLQVVTRLGDTVVGPDKMKAPPAPRGLPPEEFIDITPNKVYGATFRYLAAASRPIRGVVTDKESGKPLAGVMVRVGPSNRRHGLPDSLTTATRTDGEGRYQLLGCPKSPAYTIVALPPDTGHYFGVLRKRIPDAPGLGPMTIDVPLPRGIPIRGKLLDERTGKPIPGAKVHYYALQPNAAAILAFGEYDVESRAMTGPDGSFAVAAVPGPGFLGAHAPDNTGPGRGGSRKYKRGEVPDKEWDDFVAKYKMPTGVDGMIKNKWAAVNIGPGMSIAYVALDCFNSLALLHLDKKDKERKQDLKMRPLDKGREQDPKSPLKGTARPGMTGEPKKQGQEP